MAAFHAAIDGGVGIECDVRLSRDGVAMVFHDETLSRLCGVPISLCSLDASALRQQRLAGSNEGIPPLGELLRLVDGRVPLLIELKPGPRLQELCAAVAQDLERYSGPVGVMSFATEVGRWFAHRRSGVVRGLVVDGSGGKRPKLGEAAPDFLALSIRDVGHQWARNERAAGVPIACWTVRSPDQRRQVAVHADALIWEGDGRP